jgi:YHS domain-containing protein
MLSRRAYLAVVAAAVAVCLPALTGLAVTPALAQTAPVYTGIVKGVAVGGYDPVAYFTEKKPVKGSESITLEHGGATYRFASEANREAFKAAPDKYAPQYGGYCAWAVSEGYTAHGDPRHWTVHEGKLYLNYNRSIRTTWEKDIPGHVGKGNANWPKVLEKK